MTKQRMMILVVVLLLICCSARIEADTTSPTPPSSSSPSYDPISHNGHDRVAAAVELEKWMKAQLEDRYLELNHVRVLSDSFGNPALYATTNLTKGQPFIVIPWHLLLSIDKIFVDRPDMEPILSPLSSFSGNDDDILAVYILYLRFCSSSTSTSTSTTSSSSDSSTYDDVDVDVDVDYWLPWIRTLPGSVDNIYYFTEKEIELMKGSPLHEIAIRKTNEMQAKFEYCQQYIFPKLKKCPTFSISDWKWAKAIVASRSIQLDYLHFKTSSRVQLSLMAPYFDLLNHGHEKTRTEKGTHPYMTWGYNDRKDTLHAEVQYDVSSGDPIYIAYGEFCSDQLLERYGFYMKENVDECVHVPYRHLLSLLDPSDPLFSKKTKIISQQKWEDGGSLKIQRVGVADDLLWMIKVIMYSAGDVDDDSMLPFDIQMERAIKRCRLLIQLFRNLLEGYSTTIEQDISLINSSIYKGLSKRAQMAIQLRKEEKDVLQEILRIHLDYESDLLNPPDSTDWDEHDEL